MPPHANFAIAFAMKQDMLQSLIRVLYHDGQIPHQLTYSNSSINANLFLNLPQLVCDVANNNQYELDLSGWGDLTISLNSQTESRKIEFSVAVLVPAALQLKQGVDSSFNKASFLLFNLQAGSATIRNLKLDILSGGPYSPGIQSLLESPLFQGLVQTILQNFLGGISLFPSLNITSLIQAIGPVADVPVPSRILDNLLTFGIDVSNFKTPDGTTINTTGDPNLLSDITRGADIGIWTNPAVIPIIVGPMQTGIATAAGNQGVIFSPDITLEEGHFHIAGEASNEDGSATISLNAVPTIGMPSPPPPSYEEYYDQQYDSAPSVKPVLWFKQEDLNVDVHRPWYAVFGDVLFAFLTFGMGTLFIESLVAAQQASAAFKVSNFGGSEQSLVQTITLSATSTTQIQITLIAFECHDIGTFQAITLVPQFTAPRLFMPFWISIEEVPVVEFSISLQLPYDVLIDDPNLQILWTVRRMDTNAIVLFDNTSGVKLLLNPIRPAMEEARQFTVECSVVRVLGADAETLFHDLQGFEVHDRLDRTLPFVHWHHHVTTPVVVVQPDGSKKQTGLTLKSRTSKIHRTDFPGRCIMVTRFSKYVQSTPAEGSPYLEYLADLPFDRADILKYRKQLCDYCFFGGPTQDVPQI